MVMCIMRTFELPYKARYWGSAFPTYTLLQSRAIGLDVEPLIEFAFTGEMKK
jgi:hypothetical protein